MRRMVPMAADATLLENRLPTAPAIINGYVRAIEGYHTG